MREKLIELLGMRFRGCDNPLYYTSDEVVERIADHLIANGVTIATDNNKWIPVTERLPEKPGDYLCRVLWDGGYQGKKIHVVYYCGHNEWLLNRTDAVTHWMPLPEPPKGE